jgi:membrane-bound metal-dependent hydrolase YbcI (DUF457 family)
MMKAGHYACATPLGLAYAYGAAGLGDVHPVAAVPLAVVVVYSSTWPDLDHPRFKGRIGIAPFFAALVRGTAAIVYRVNEDYHRGPSHSIEWCVLVGVLIGGLTVHAGLPGAAGVWVGGAVALGTASHILADLMTPSGVPVCATWNYLRHGEP